jgi:hypothetical protein
MGIKRSCPLGQAELRVGRDLKKELAAVTGVKELAFWAAP